MEIFQELFTPVFFWLALMAIFIVAEIVTVGLTGIWFAGGALIALLAEFVGMPFIGQVVLFFAVSFILLFGTRPFALKYVKPHNVKTNYEEVIGSLVKVTETIDNRAGSGTAVYNGQEWTARSADGDEVIEAGAMAKVAEVRGVKLYVTKA